MDVGLDVGLDVSGGSSRFNDEYVILRHECIHYFLSVLLFLFEGFLSKFDVVEYRLSVCEYRGVLLVLIDDPFLFGQLTSSWLF